MPIATNMDNEMHRSTSQAVSPVTIVGDDERDNDVDVSTNVSESSNVVASGSPIKKPRTKWRKPEGKPHHPRTGYNFFFQLERERMLLRIDDTPITPEDVANLQIGASRVNKVLTSRRDGSDQSIRPRALSGEKLGFAELARNIASKWNQLDSTIKALFDEKAEKERIRYKRELEEWNEQEKAKRQKVDIVRNPSTCSLTEHLPTAPDQTEVPYQTPASNNVLLPGILSNTAPSATKNESTGVGSLPINSSIRHDGSQQFYIGQGQSQKTSSMFDKYVSPNHEMWNSSGLSVRDDLSQCSQWHNTQRVAVSPPEFTRKTKSITSEENIPLGRTFISNNVPPPTNDISSKINQFIEDVCCVSEDLHEFTKITNFDEPLSPELQDMEMYLDCCIGLVRRLSTQIRNSSRNQQETCQGHFVYQRNQILHGSSNSKDLAFDKFQRGRNSIDIQSIMNEVRNTVNGTDRLDEFEIQKRLESRRLLVDYESAVAANSEDTQNCFQTVSGSNAPPSHGHHNGGIRDSSQRHYNRPFTYSAHQNTNMLSPNDISRSVSSSNYKQHGSNHPTLPTRQMHLMSPNRDLRQHNTMQHSHQLHMRSDRNGDAHPDGSSVSHKFESNRISLHNESCHRHFINRENKGSDESRCYTPIDASLELGDDTSYIGNLDCEGAFDMESMVS